MVPPCLSVLKQRLSARATESPEVIQKRLQQAQQEIKQAGEYDYIVINDHLEEAVEQIHSIITAEKSRIKYFHKMIKEFLNNESTINE